MKVSHHNGLANGSSKPVTNGDSTPVANNQNKKQESSSSPVKLFCRDYLLLAICAGCGFAFGVAAEKAKVHLPSVIWKQMLFQQNAMLKTFLAAVTASLLSFILLCALPLTRKLFDHVRVEFGKCVSFKSMAAFLTGGTILGMGMTVSGACPGMVIVQMGAGTDNAIMTLAGCFVGSLIYGGLEPTLRKYIITRTHKHILSSIWMDKLLGVPYIVTAVGLATLTGGVALAVEYWVPWRTDSVPVSSPEVSLLAQKSWSPIYAGIIMGSLQVPIALAVCDSLGGSSSYCTLLSQSHWLSQALPYFYSFKSGVGNWWQVSFWIGAAGGSAMSAVASGSWGTAVGVAPPTAIVGGALMLFGARLASGCTSGHGLSGFALLSLASLIAVPAMFAGGIGLALVTQILLRL